MNLSKLLITVCVLGLLATGRAAAQDDPVRLQRKARPPEPPPAKTDKDKAKDATKEKDKTPDAKPTPKDDLKTEDPEELERQAQEIINKLTKEFRTVEDRLQKKDPGDNTQKVQKDILGDLDDLIEQTRKQEEQMQQQQQQGSSSMTRRQRMMMSQQQRRQRGQQAQRQGQRQQRGQQLTRQQQQPDMQQPNGNPQGERDRNDSGALKTADLYKDIWGHLPETLRQEMSQYTREQFMAKYNDLLKQYFATIAEKGRKQQDK
jgi:hypothetical protein